MSNDELDDLNKMFIPYEEALYLANKKANFKSYNTYSTENHLSVKPGILLGAKPSEPLMGAQMHKIGVWYIPAPLYQQAFEWIYEKYGLYAETTLWGDGIGFTSIIKRKTSRGLVYSERIVTKNNPSPNWDLDKEKLNCLKELIKFIKN